MTDTIEANGQLTSAGSEKRHVRWRLLTSLLVAIALVVPATVAFVTVELQDRQEISASTASSRKLALVLLSNFERTVETIDVFLDGLADLPALGSPQAVYERLRDSKLPASVIQASFIAADGKLVATSLVPPGTNLDLSDREHIRVHLDGLHSADGVFLSRPVKGRISGAWSIQFTKGLRAADGKLLGIVVASYQISDFIDFYNQLRPDGGGLVALIGLDGVVRASAPPPELAGREADMIFPEFDQFSGVPMGPYMGTSEGTERVGYFARSQRYPFLVLVAADVATLLAQSNDFRTGTFMVAAILGATLLSLALVGFRHFKLERAYREKAMQATAHQREAQVLQAISRVPGINVVHLADGRTTRFGDAETEGPLPTLIEERVASSAFAERVRAGDAPAVSIERFSSGGEEYEVKFVVAALERMPGESAADVSTPSAAVVFALDETAKRMEENKLYQMSKMAALGELVTGLAHEINQPLGVIRLAAGNALAGLQSGMTAAHTQEKLDRILRQVERMRSIIDHMRIFGRKSALELEPSSVTGAVDGTLQVLGTEIRLDGIELDVDCTRHLDVLCRQEQLEQVLINLVLNARDAIRSRRKLAPGLQGGIVIRTEERRIDGKGFAAITVRDNGGGIPESAIGRIFHPFFTTKPAGQGTGLGLSVSFGIIREHGGSLTVTNDDDGAIFTILLPRIDVQLGDISADEPVLKSA